jgi:hypothetical protein
MEGAVASSCEHSDKLSCSGATKLVSYLNISISYSLCRNIKQFPYLNSPITFHLPFFEPMEAEPLYGHSVLLPMEPSSFKLPLQDSRDCVPTFSENISEFLKNPFADIC